MILDNTRTPLHQTPIGQPQKSYGSTLTPIHGHQTTIGHQMPISGNTMNDMAGKPPSNMIPGGPGVRVPMDRRAQAPLQPQTPTGTNKRPVRPTRNISRGGGMVATTPAAVNVYPGQPTQQNPNGYQQGSYNNTWNSQTNIPAANQQPPIMQTYPGTTMIKPASITNIRPQGVAPRPTVPYQATTMQPGQPQPQPQQQPGTMQATMPLGYVPDQSGMMGQQSMMTSVQQNIPRPGLGVSSATAKRKLAEANMYSSDQTAYAPQPKIIPQGGMNEFENKTKIEQY